MNKTFLSTIVLAAIVNLPAAQAAPFGVDDTIEAQTATLSAPGTYDISSSNLFGSGVLANYGVYDASGNFNAAIDLNITDPVGVNFSLSASANDGVQLTGVFLVDDNTDTYYNQALSYNALTGIYTASGFLGALSGANWELEVYGAITGPGANEFSGNLSVAAVPVPGAFSLMALSLPLVSLAARRKKTA